MYFAEAPEIYESTLNVLLTKIRKFSWRKCLKGIFECVALFGADQSRLSRLQRVLPSLLVVFLLFLAAISMIGSLPIFAHSNASSSATGISLVNLETFNDYGQFQVNDTLAINSTASGTVPSVTFGYPANYIGHIVEFVATMDNKVNVSSDISSSVQDNSLHVTVNLPISDQLSASSPGNVTLSFYVVGTYISENTTASACTTCYYSVPMLLYPSLSIPSFSTYIGHIASNISFPDPSVTEPPTNSTPAGYGTFTSSTLYQLYNSTNLDTNTSSYTNSVHWTNTTIGSTSTSGGIVDFQSIQRSFSVGPSGDLVVKDSIVVRNLGPNTLSSLNYGVLTASNSTTAVTIVPPSPTLPLTDTETVNATDGSLDVLSASEDTIQPNASVVIVLQYPLGQQYGNFSGGTYTATIPETLPVDAIVDLYKTSFTIPSGYTVTHTPLAVTLTNTSGSGVSISLSYRSGVGSAYSFMLPISGIAFVGVFIAALVFKPRGGKKEEEIESTLTSLIKAAEDKVSGTNDILTELKSRGASVTRNDLATARIRIEELRSKSSGRFGSIRTELVSAGTSAQAALSDVAGDDREFDRAVRDLLNTYDQYVAKRMKQESFTKAQQNNERRIQRTTNTLLDGLEDLRTDYEQEQ
jgi:hypothetical protein